jgi:hypothetical protein
MSLKMSIRGQLASDAHLITAPSNPEIELLQMTVATTLHGFYDRNNGNKWVDVIEYYKVNLSFKKGMVDRWVENNLLVKGQTIDIENLLLVRGKPTSINGKHYHNNTFRLLPDCSMHDSIRFLKAST